MKIKRRVVLISFLAFIGLATGGCMLMHGGHDHMQRETEKQAIPSEPLKKDSAMSSTDLKTEREANGHDSNRKRKVGALWILGAVGMSAMMILMLV